MAPYGERRTLGTDLLAGSIVTRTLDLSSSPGNGVSGLKMPDSYMASIVMPIILPTAQHCITAKKQSSFKESYDIVPWRWPAPFGIATRARISLKKSPFPPD